MRRQGEGGRIGWIDLHLHRTLLLFAKQVSHLLLYHSLSPPSSLPFSASAHPHTHVLSPLSPCSHSEPVFLSSTKSHAAPFYFCRSPFSPVPSPSLSLSPSFSLSPFPSMCPPPSPSLFPFLALFFVLFAFLPNDQYSSCLCSLLPPPSLE